jgi:hypothetical protein
MVLSKRQQSKPLNISEPLSHISSKFLNYVLFSRHLTVYVSRSHIILALEYRYFMYLRIAGFLGFLRNRDFVWDLCEGESCNDHECLQKKARKKYRYGRDSQETREEIAGSWQESVAPPLNPVFARDIQAMEEEVSTNWRSICAKLDASEEYDYDEEYSNKNLKDDSEGGDDEDKINKILVQVGALSACQW